MLDIGGLETQLRSGRPARRGRHQDGPGEPGAPHRRLYAGHLRPCDRADEAGQRGPHGPFYRLGRRGGQTERIREKIRENCFQGIEKTLESRGFQGFSTGARGGSRTRTPLRALAPEASESTNSTTRANGPSFSQRKAYDNTANRGCQQFFSLLTKKGRDAIIGSAGGKSAPKTKYADVLELVDWLA